MAIQNTKKNGFKYKSMGPKRTNGVSQKSKVIKKNTPNSETFSISKKKNTMKHKKQQNKETNEFGDTSKETPDSISSLCNDKNVIDIEDIMQNVVLGPKQKNKKNITEIQTLVQNMIKPHVDIVFYLSADQEGASGAKIQRLLKFKKKLSTKYGKRTQDLIRKIDNQLSGNKDNTLMDLENAPPPTPNMKFSDFSLSEPINKAIEKEKYLVPTDVQKVVVPLGVEGRDVLACAKTGTGKTAAYLLPILERLLHAPDSVPTTRVLIILPTRELAMQVYENAVSLSAFTNITTRMAVGGLKTRKQENYLKKKPDIIVATPGRLLGSLMNSEKLTLKDIEILVIDEADRMLDISFKEQISPIIEKLSRVCQIFLLSATMTENVQDLAMFSLKNAVRAFVSKNTDIATTLKQEFTKITKEEDRLPALLHLLINVYVNRILIFVPLKTQCNALYILLSMAGRNAAELHGDQTQRERMNSLNEFKSGACDILIATDIASRGLDIAGITTVINLFLPAGLETYIHRAGRAGRAGKVGYSVSIFSTENEVERTQFKIIKNESTLDIFQRDISEDALKRGRLLIEKLLPFVNEAFKLVSLKRGQYIAMLDKRYNSKEGDSRTFISKSMTNVKKTSKYFHCPLLVDAVYQKKDVKSNKKKYLKKMERGNKKK